MKKKVKRSWHAAVTAVVILTILTFTPAIIPYGQYKPELLGIPYTLWTGILVGMAIVGLTIYGSTVCPGSKKWEESR
jgi:hypothetical protein